VMHRYDAPHRMENGMGIAALLLGLFALPWSIVPIVGFFCWPFVITGMILGMTGVRKADAGLATNRVMAYLGFWLSFMAFMMPMVILLAAGMSR
jgi:hypothetical protein